MPQFQDKSSTYASYRFRSGVRANPAGMAQRNKIFVHKSGSTIQLRPKKC